MDSVPVSATNPITIIPAFRAGLVSPERCLGLRPAWMVPVHWVNVAFDQLDEVKVAFDQLPVTGRDTAVTTLSRSLTSGNAVTAVEIGAHAASGCHSPCR